MFDFSFGFKDGAIKFAKVLLWVAISGAITALINYFKALDFGEWVVVQGMINSLLAGLLKWSEAKK